MTEEIHVRVGTQEDEEAIIALCKQIHAENAIFEMDEEKVRAMVRPALWRIHGIVGIIGPKEKIEGIVILSVSQFWYSQKKFLEELFVFVPPKYRGGKAGHGGNRAGKLIDFAKKVSDQTGLPLMIGVLSNHRTEGKTRFYKRKFGEPSGAFFLYGAKTGQFNFEAQVH